jgi:tetratricopeptide (TPR) repeat protein
MNRQQDLFEKQQKGAGTQGPSQVIQALLGNALWHHQAGRWTEAERIYRQILAVDAQHADSLHLLGMIAYQAGRHDAAAEMIRKAIAINEKEAAYHSNLGIVLQAQGRLDEAAACYERALALKPDSVEVHINFGNILEAQGKLDEAVACQERALALKPDCAEAHSNLGNLRQAQDQRDEAVVCYERALALKPDYAEAHGNLGNALQVQGKLDEAVACYERALALKPDYAKAHHNLGCVLYSLGNLDEALVRQRRALALQPGYSQARFSESLAQLSKGDFSAGWRNYESRWQTPEHNTPMRAYPQPLWTGEELAPGRLLIWGEQGVGDEIMFAGLIPDVIRTGNRCILDCDARLKPLFVRSFPGIDVVSGHNPGHDPELDIAAHLPSGSLPGLFRATDTAFAATTSPYLIADPVERERFRTRYADGRRLVGLAWHTNNRKTGRNRSIDLPLLAAPFAPLFARPDIRWISLQYGDHDALEDQVAAARAPILIDRAVHQFSDIDVFAAQIAAMDLVITIDNSTAHLAGALGVPVWLLLPFAPDWRWLRARERSPWYPTMRLFRQPKLGDWQSVVQRVQSVF